MITKFPKKSQIKLSLQNRCVNSARNKFQNINAPGAINKLVEYIASDFTKFKITAMEFRRKLVL
jgi:hypothetical protein